MTKMRNRGAMKIKNRTVALYRICVAMGGRCFKIIHLTKKQLARLNKLTPGKEVFLSHAYCHVNGGFWVIRTENGLQYMPFPHCGSAEDIFLLKSMMEERG